MFVICFAYNRSVQYTSNWSGKSKVMNSMITWVSVSSQLNTFYKSARSTKESIIWFMSQCLLPSSQCAGERRTGSTIVRYRWDASLQQMTWYLPYLACGKRENRYKNLRAITSLQLPPTINENVCLNLYQNLIHTFNSMILFIYTWSKVLVELV